MKIIHYFSYFLIMCIHTINASQDQIAPTNINMHSSFFIEEDHIIAAEHALMVFHAFEQSKTTPINDYSDFNFNEPIINKGLFNLYALVRCAIPENVTQGWQL